MTRKSSSTYTKKRKPSRGAEYSTSDDPYFKKLRLETGFFNEKGIQLYGGHFATLPKMFCDNIEAARATLNARDEEPYIAFSVIVTDLIKRSINRIKPSRALKIPTALTAEEFAVVVGYVSPKDFEGSLMKRVSFSNPMWLRHELQMVSLPNLKGRTGIPPKIVELLRLETLHACQSTDDHGTIME